MVVWCSMIKTQEEYEALKRLLEDNKNGNFFSKGNYLGDDNVAFILDEIEKWETKQAKLEAYYQS